jgi:hypothetical protein
MARKIHKKLDDRHYSIIAKDTMRHWVLPKDELVLCRGWRQPDIYLVGRGAAFKAIMLQLIICLPACSKLTVTFIPTMD